MTRSTLYTKEKQTTIICMVLQNIIIRHNVTLEKKKNVLQLFFNIQNDCSFSLYIYLFNIYKSDSTTKTKTFFFHRTVSNGEFKKKANVNFHKFNINYAQYIHMGKCYGTQSVIVILPVLHNYPRHHLLRLLVGFFFLYHRLFSTKLIYRIRLQKNLFRHKFQPDKRSHK